MPISVQLPSAITKHLFSTALHLVYLRNGDDFWVSNGFIKHQLIVVCRDLKLWASYAGKTDSNMSHAFTWNRKQKLTCVLTLYVCRDSSLKGCLREHQTAHTHMFAISLTHIVVVGRNVKHKMIICLVCMVGKTVRIRRVNFASQSVPQFQPRYTAEQMRYVVYAPIVKKYEKKDKMTLVLSPSYIFEHHQHKLRG